MPNKIIAILIGSDTENDLEAIRSILKTDGLEHLPAALLELTPPAVSRSYIPVPPFSFNGGGRRMPVSRIPGGAFDRVLPNVSWRVDVREVWIKVSESPALWWKIDSPVEVLREGE